MFIYNFLIVIQYICEKKENIQKKDNNYEYNYNI